MANSGEAQQQPARTGCKGLIAQCPVLRSLEAAPTKQLPPALRQACSGNKGVCPCGAWRRVSMTNCFRDFPDRLEMNPEIHCHSYSATALVRNKLLKHRLQSLAIPFKKYPAGRDLHLAEALAALR